ncbi:hypothetical protein CHS0354_020324, partial [Potamilus streckersoni]
MEYINTPVCESIQKVQNNQNHKDKPDAHPRYLTLYIHYPTKPHKQPSDSNIIKELLKHKPGQIQIKHTKTSGSSIRCFTGAQIRAYKKIKMINNISVNICNHYTYNKTNGNKSKQQNTQHVTKYKVPRNNRNQGKGLIIWQWNCRGIYQNQLELQAAILETNEKPMIICLQETQLTLTNSKPALPKIKNYQKLSKTTKKMIPG